MQTLSQTPTQPQDNALPAGGSDPNRFDWQEVWYPVHYLEDLDKSQLTRFTLLNRNLVIWWDKNVQTWRVFADLCPHRLAPLSEGRINEEGFLECPYHGWSFSGTGKCEVIPQQPPEGTAEDSPRACVASLPTAEAQGLLFVYAGKPENAPQVTVPIIPALEDGSDEWVCLNTFRDLPYDALTLMENVLDSSHIPYTHHKSVGNRAYVSPVELEVAESGKQGFQGFWEEGPRKGTLGRQETTFIAPNLMWHDLTSKQFGRTLTVVYATPIRKGECRIFARFPFKFSSKIPGLFMKLTPHWFNHLGQNGVLEDDQIFLHYQERYLEELGGSENFAKAFYLPTKADRFVIELRQWVNKYDALPFPDSHLSPPLSKNELLNRYESHTVHCASCSTALKNLQRLKMGAMMLAILAWTITPLLAVIWGKVAVWGVAGLTVVSLVSVGLWLGLSKLERQFYQGREIPPRNFPEKR